MKYDPNFVKKNKNKKTIDRMNGENNHQQSLFAHICCISLTTRLRFHKAQSEWLLVLDF